MLDRLNRYEITEINPTHPTVPGTDLDCMAGIFRAKRRAIEIARSENRAVAIWCWPEVDQIRDRQKRWGLVPEQPRWVRYYSAGAPLVTAGNLRTIARLAACEDRIHQRESQRGLASMLRPLMWMAEDSDLPAVKAALAAARAEVERAGADRQEAADRDREALDSRHWPREAREEPLTAA